MSLSCREALLSLPDYAAENLQRPARQALREHLAACGQCREAAVHADPGLLFAASPSAGPAVGDEDVAQILARVRAGIAWRQAERRLTGDTPRRPRSRRLAATAAAAVVALALLLPASTSRRAAPRAVSNLAPSRVQAQTLGPVVPAARPAAPEVPTSKFPADATIYDLSPGAGEPRVVWIVDRSLDI